MSTRSSTHFMVGDTVRANVYRHADGYPEGHGKDIYEFFKDVEFQCVDKRFDDPTYLAAKMVVWLADKMAPYSHYNYDDPVERKEAAKMEPLNFLSVGVQIEDPFDIEYVYKIHCDRFDNKGRPIVECFTTGNFGRRVEQIDIPVEVHF